MKRLTREQVADARRRYARHQATAALLAAEFGVSVSAVKHAVTGRTWAHMSDPPPVRRPQTRQGPTPGRTPALTQKSVGDIVRLRDTEALPWRTIGALYGVDASVAFRAHRAAKRRRTRQNPGLVQRLPPYARRLRALWADPDLTVSEIVATLGITWRAATKCVADMGLPPPKERPGRRRRAVLAVQEARTVTAGKADKQRQLRVLWTDPEIRARDIPVTLGISWGKMHEWAAEMGLPPRPQRRRRGQRQRLQQQQELRALWDGNEGIPAARIAKALGVSRATIYIWATEMGLPERQRRRRRARPE